MEKIKPIVLFIIALVFVYIIATIYTNRIENIENGELIQISDEYMD